jgi:hypothetical protein
MSLVPIVKVLLAETALDTGHLPGKQLGRSLRLGGHLLTSRLLSSAATSQHSPASTTATTYTAARTTGGNSHHLGRLVHIHQRGMEAVKLLFIPCRDQSASAFLAKARTF